MAFPIAAALMAGGTVVGQHLANRENKRAAQAQIAFQRDMSNTSYVRGMQDMKNAGLNPILAGKMGGASTPGGASYQAKNIMEGAANSAQSAMQTKQLSQQVDITGKSARFANITGIPIEYANPFMKQAYSASYMTKNAFESASTAEKMKPGKPSPKVKINKKTKLPLITEKANKFFDGSTFLKGKKYNMFGDPKK